jgi:hypothetical protein
MVALSFTAKISNQATIALKEMKIAERKRIRKMVLKLGFSD